MVTPGKKFSSSVAVGVAWVGGAGLAQLAYIGLVAAALRERGFDGIHADGTLLWWSAALPLAAAVGGALSIGVMRLASGWPKLNLGALFLCALFSAAPALVLLTLRNAIWVALAAALLGVIGVMAYTWGAASEGKLGTRMASGATLTPGQDGGEG